VLTAEQRQALDARITAVQQAGLGDIAVAILPSIGPYTPNQVAVEIYRTWKVGSVAAIGSAHKDVGVLLLIVPKELAPDGRGQCWINTGLGSEGLLTDARAAAICRDSIIPHLRTRDYAGAIGAGVGAIESRMRSDPALTTTPANVGGVTPGASTREPPVPPSVPVFILSGLALLGVVFGTMKYRRNRARTCPRCGRRMHRLTEEADDKALDRGQRLEEILRSVDYDVWACECGETTVIPYRRWFSTYRECRECHRKTASSDYVVLVPATTISAGEAEKRFTCAACGAKWTEHIILPRISTSSSSSSSGGGGGGGGGGSSFGGSGATSGGGGGSSY
jgi:uncharacterized protein